jgi:hypothetical protein
MARAALRRGQATPPVTTQSLSTLRVVAGEDADAYADVRERYLRPRRAHLDALLRMATYSAGDMPANHSARDSHRGFRNMTAHLHRRCRPTFDSPKRQ